MPAWIRFADLRPYQGEFIVAITHHGTHLPIEVWEKDLERNAVGVWIDCEVWGGGMSSADFTPDLSPQKASISRFRLYS